MALVAVPFMGETGRQLCQEKGVGYVDLSGNAHIEAPGLLIRVEGRPNRFAERGRPASVFAPRSSRVSRVLLREADRWWSQRELVESTELGRGYVSRIVRRLHEDGLVEYDKQNRIRPSDPGVLLDAWHSEYSVERHDVLIGHVSARSGDQLTRKVAETCHFIGVSYAVTGLAGAALLAPFADYRRVSIYLDRLPGESLLRQLGFRAEPRGANLWIMRPRDASVLWDARDVAEIRCASPLQVYLDLKGMPERAQEAAEHLRDMRLKWSRHE